MNPNRFSALLNQQGYILLDGGLATELEQSGHDLRHPLWSAKLLVENPAAIKEVHKSFALAGSNCLLSASYQLSFAGGKQVGLSKKEVNNLLLNSVDLVRAALDESDLPSEDQGLVGASLGPYGASLGNGAEYTGIYEVGQDHLRDFHIRRLAIMSQSNADVIAFETIPNIYEAEVIRRLVEEFPTVACWISFSCRNGLQINDGSNLAETAGFFNDCPNIVGVGINCTKPSFVTSLIKQIKKGAPNKAIIAYPNSGETYDGTSRSWSGEQKAEDFGSRSATWFQDGAHILGGCCRTRPQHIEMIKQQLQRS